MGEAISLTDLYHFHQLHGHLDISRRSMQGARLYAWIAAGFEPGAIDFLVQVANQ